VKTILAIAVGLFSIACSGPSREADNNHYKKGQSSMSSTSHAKKRTIGELKAQGYSEVQRVPLLSPPSNVNGVIAEGTLGASALVFARPNKQDGATSIRYRCDVPENMRFDRQWSEEAMAKWTCELIDG
jgi:hypothetical protein